MKLCVGESATFILLAVTTNDSVQRVYCNIPSQVTSLLR